MLNRAQPPVVHEDRVSCEDCGREIIHLVIDGDGLSEWDASYYTCADCERKSREG